MQRERQQRWKELKPLFHLETSTGAHPHLLSTVNMAADEDKMAAENHHHQMADDEMDQWNEERQRPSTPLPSVGAAFKRQRCGCFPADNCQCGKDTFQLSKKYRLSPPDEDEDEGLKSLDQFLSSLQCNSRQVVDWQSIYNYQVCHTE